MLIPRFVSNWVNAMIRRDDNGTESMVAAQPDCCVSDSCTTQLDGEAY
jgi:hypothetical protein